MIYKINKSFGQKLKTNIISKNKNKKRAFLAAEEGWGRRRRRKKKVCLYSVGL
uniref:Uncharacterized protein n=1 Tax=Anguilla anguilla TaxID=7936 RepID=A0A0E9X7V3_ANGAN